MPHTQVAKDYLQSQFMNIIPQCDESNPTEMHHLAWMLTEIAKDEMSPTKSNRWLGYVQGIMTANKMLDVNSERDRTRTIFNGA